MPAQKGMHKHAGYNAYSGRVIKRACNCSSVQRCRRLRLQLMAFRKTTPTGLNFKRTRHLQIFNLLFVRTYVARRSLHSLHCTTKQAVGGYVFICALHIACRCRRSRRLLLTGWTARRGHGSLSDKIGNNLPFNVHISKPNNALTPSAPRCARHAATVVQPHEPSTSINKY